ncbi:MAG: polysaccharide biosynthesis protein, partial [Clostridia bacterium]|nr:polysaccharide biosynthesis protein [Clostridia bacterium]
MKRNKSESFLQSTMVLMAASIIVKIIGALFSIPLTNLYGADGNGIFTVAYYIYTAMFIISTAGLPVAVSKMVAEAKALGRIKETKRIGKVALVSFAAIGLFFTLVMIFGVDFFMALAKSNMARKAVLAVAPTIFFICIVSAIRGYYQGLSNMIPTAVSQVIEALGKLVFGLFLAYYLMHKGYGLETVVAGAIGGVTIGTVLSAIYIFEVRLKDARADRLDPGVSESGDCRPSGEIFKKLIKIAVPITIGSSVLSVTNLIDTFVVLARLQEGCNLTDVAANHLYGAYGMSVKFFNLPQTVIVGIGVSVIPAIAAALAKREEDNARLFTESAFRLTGLLAFPCAIGLAVLSKPILSLFYYRQQSDAAEAAPLLVLLGPAVFFVAMVSVTNAVLQASGNIWLPVFSMTLGGLIKLTTNYFLVGTPGINISGAPIGTCLCYGTITVLNLIFIRNKRIRFSLLRVFLKPLTAAAVMGAFAFFIYSPLSALITGLSGSLLSGFLRQALTLAVTLFASAVLYCLMLIALKALPKEDVLMLPKGEKIAKIL